ncbi:MAG: hypothetical protein WD738_16055 [Pirellulales bacterium]
MNKTLRSIGLLWFAGWAMVASSLAHGRDLDQATNLYSQGVHNYFAGRFSDAESSLSRAIGVNDDDPRFYYFRAFSRLRLGRDYEARLDMAAGAALEATHLNRYAVGTALQRVQGSHRLLLEQFRRDARSRAASTGAQVAEQQAEQMTVRDAGALRERVIIPLNELLRPGAPQALSADEVVRRAAAAQQVRAVPAPTVEVPAAAPAATAEDDPFRDDARAPAAEPSPPASSEPSPPAEPPLPEDDESDDNPFDS